jgi:GNAT superfamily N-acetyltransferase
MDEQPLQVWQPRETQFHIAAAQLHTFFFPPFPHTPSTTEVPCALFVHCKSFVATKLTLPDSWFAALMRALYALRDRLAPIPHVSGNPTDIFNRVLHEIEPYTLNTPRRQNAWYLSTLALWPHLQGRGLGSLLLDHGMQRARQNAAASWLISLAGVDAFYRRHGFVEIGRANVGELAHWDGGILMINE